MEQDQSEKVSHLELNKYFENSTSCDIFDQISNFNALTETENEKSAFTDDKIENNDCQIKFSEECKIVESKQPVICRIFSTLDKSEKCDKKVDDATFFDTLSTNNEYTKFESSADNSLKIDVAIKGYSDDAVFSTSSEHNVDSDILMKNISHIFEDSDTVSTRETDRMNDAWIPSNRTRQALVAFATTSPGSYTPERNMLTMPGVVLQEDMLDNVHEAVNHYLGEVEAAQRKVLTLNDVTQDERGLRELIQAECYRAAVNLTSRLLTMYGQGIGRAGYASKHTFHSIQLWFTRIALLVKLKSWSVAWAESEPWWDLDRPDLYFQFYSELYGGRPGTIVPFSFRLLLAELPQYVHKPQEAFKRLFSTLSTVRKILQNLNNNLSEDGRNIVLSTTDREASKEVWMSRKIRILHSIVNLALQQKNYKLSVDILKEVVSKPDFECNNHYHRTLISVLGRIYLQMGDTLKAKHWFDKSSSSRPSNQSNQNTGPDFQELVDNGLLAIANSDYEKGCEYFQKASSKDPTNIMVKNNIAVCLLYCGKRKEAVNLLESTTNTNPVLSLHESLLLNLCTLYELESSIAIDNKYKMLKMVSKYKGDAITLNCLKLQIKE